MCLKIIIEKIICEEQKQKVDITKLRKNKTQTTEIFCTKENAKSCLKVKTKARKPWQQDSEPAEISQLRFNTFP